MEHEAIFSADQVFTLGIVVGVWLVPAIYTVCSVVKFSWEALTR